jgi:hypothetical protein
MRIRGDRLAIVVGLLLALVLAVVVLGAQRDRAGSCGGGRESAFVSLTYSSEATGYATVREAADAALRAADIPEARSVTPGSRLAVLEGGDVQLTRVDGTTITLHRAGGIEGDGILFHAVSTCR